MPPINHHLAGWIPFALRVEPSGVVIDWCHLGGRRFLEPFFDQTITQRRRDPDQLRGVRVTSAQELVELADSTAAPPPSGFIFHPSRSGSTAIAQMLASLPQARVLSEPGVLTTLLHKMRMDEAYAGEEQRRLLRGLVGSLAGFPRTPETRYFIKFDSRAILSLPLLRQVFPEVPWVFVYREPHELLGAQGLLPLRKLPPGVVHAGLMQGDPLEFERMDPVDFWIQVLASRFAAALEAYEPRQALLVNYQQLPAAVWECCLPFFGIGCLEEDVARMRATSAWNAKDPARLFVDDGASKRRAAGPFLKALADSTIMEQYRSLEALRLDALF